MARRYRGLLVWQKAMGLVEFSYRKEFTRFLTIALGSVAELETLSELCQRLGYFDEKAVGPARATADEVGRMLNAMHRTLTAPHVSELGSDEVPEAAFL